MAEIKMEIPYVKSPQWRAVSATGVAANAIGGAVGLEFLMRFTYEWVDIDKEIISGTKSEDAVGESFTVTGPPQIVASPLIKIEEVAIRMPTEGTVAFVTTMVTQLGQLEGAQKLSSAQIQRVRAAFAKFPTS